MRGLRAPLRTYVLGVIFAGAAATAAAAPAAAEATSRELLLAGMLALCAAALRLWPVHLSRKIKFTAEESVVFAGVLALSPPLALLAGAASTLLGVRRSAKVRWYNRAFNAAVAGLATGAAAALYRWLAPEGEILAALPAILAAAATKYLLHTAMVDLAAALQLRRDALRSWWPIHRRDLPHSAALYAVGTLMAPAALAHPWAVPLIALPSVLVVASMRENARLRAQTRAALERLSDLIDLRDPYTHGHSLRVAALAERIAVRLGLTAVQIELIREAARVHDIGKIATPDHVLRKPGPLEDHELPTMREHVEHGREVLRGLFDFWEGADLVYSHHERFDGTGYPRGLRGNELPLEVSIISVADTCDAMTSDRPYRRAMPWEAVRAELLRERGRQWHERPVDALIEIIEEDRAAPAQLASA